jgi:FkbM family methyltransferase
VRAKDRVRHASRWAEPAVLGAIREASEFAASHGIATGRRRYVPAFRHARRYGIQLLPAGRRLDGLVVDVGANSGDFTAAVLDLEPRARAVAIEPTPATFERLRGRFAGDARVTPVREAVSDERGTVTFNVTANDVLASMLTPREILNEAYANSAVVTETITVPTAPLDELVPGDAPIKLLKIDVQGAEMKLLAGAANALARAEAVLLEVNFVSQYEGDALFFDLHPEMLARGFALASLGEINQRGGLAMWADACYVPVSR